MKIVVLEEAGLSHALRGMAYSYKDRAIDPDEWWQTQYPRALERAPKLARLGAGHNKFLRQIMLWVDIEAPRLWWSEFDTYKVGPVSQSESTMHTLAKRPPTIEDFEDDTPVAAVEAFASLWPSVKHDVAVLKSVLPEGFLQRRMVTMNYAVVQAIVEQRLKHRLHHWQAFIQAMRSQLQNPEYINWETSK